MERLTEDFKNGQYGVRGCGENCKYNFAYCNQMEDCPAIDEVINKLGKYEDLEEQGLLLRLPCKVGDTVYTINIEYDYTECEYEETADECVFITCPNRDCHSKKIRLFSINEFSVDSLSWLVDIIEHGRFGKTVFLTREEAEQALEQKRRMGR